MQLIKLVKNPGIQSRILFAAFFMIFFSTLILDVVGVHMTSSFMRKRFFDRISFLAKYLALNSEVGVLIGDKEGLNLLALNLLGEEDVTRVTIMNSEGKTVAFQEREATGPISVIKMPIVFKSKQDETQLFNTLTTPFGKYHIKKEEFIGEVQISYTTIGIEQLLKEMTSNFVLFSIGLASVAGFVFFLISRPIVKEVKQLAATAQQVGRGDLELRAKPGKIQETKSLANDFNAMLDSLKKSQTALEQVHQEMMRQRSLAEIGKFSLMIAHEVKNPLSIIKSSMDVLKKDVDLSAGAMLVEYIEDEIKQLNKLIEDFLTYARPVKPVFRPADVNTIIHEIIDRFEIQGNGAGIEYHPDETISDLVITMDPDLIGRALSNIVKNGLESIEMEGKIEIRTFIENGSLYIDISDNGNGIEECNLSKIFEPFFTTRAKGTGLGLAFTAQVIAAHNGRIHAENLLTGGARFRVMIPVREGQHPAAIGTHL
jgi:signal transduction histidine kinase